MEAAGHERATADLVLPATHLFGKVVLDESGQPVPAATVSFSSVDQQLITGTTDDKGGFELRGFTPGTIYAGATFSKGRESWTSDRVVFTVGDGEDHGPVELRLRKTRQVAGIVQSGFGPVPGAGVAIVPFRPGVMFGELVRTDVDGSFTAQVPAVTEAAAAVVSAGGFALQAFVLSPGETPKALQVSEAGGHLLVVLPEKPKEAEMEDFSLWIFQNGLPLPTGALYQWAVGLGKEPTDPSGRSMDIPNVAPGEYRACIVSRSVLVPWEASGWTAPLAKCATGQLSADGSVRLDLSSHP